MLKCRSKRILILLICALTTSVAYSRDYSDLYSKRELRAALTLYSKSLPYVWRDDFLGRLTANERRLAPKVQLSLPLIGGSKSPFDYQSVSTTQVVTIPIISVKFLDDLSIAQAYLEKNNCRSDAVFDYVALLGRDATFPHTPPLRALGIPDDALKDPYVNKTSGNALKSAIYYIMAHEYAHVMYKHQGYSQITASQAQAQEIEADNFAMTVMNRIGVPPLGIVPFFSLLSMYDRVPSDFKTIKEYEEHLKYSSTHPLSSKRLINIANILKSDPAGFARSEPDPVSWASRILSAANDIEVVGKNLDDSNLREYQIRKALKQTKSSLASACNHK